MAAHPQMKTGEPPGGGWTPVPDPTELTNAAVRESKAQILELIGARLDAYDKVFALLNEQQDRLPKIIEKSVADLERLINERRQNVEQSVALFRESVKTQFEERDKRADLLSAATEKAISAALQAQKESAGATNDTNAVAQNKMESQFAKLLDQQRELLGQSVKTLDGKISEVSSRLDRGEGKTSVSDPAVAEGMKQLAGIVADLAKSRDTTAGIASQSPWGLIIGAAAVVGMVVLSVILVASRMAGAQ